MKIANKDYVAAYNLALRRKKMALFNGFSALKYIRRNKDNGPEDGLLKWAIVVKLLGDSLKNYYMEPGISIRMIKLVEAVKVHNSLRENYKRKAERIEKIALFFHWSLYDFLIDKNIPITISYYRVDIYCNVTAKFLLYISNDRFLEFDLEYSSNRTYYVNGRFFESQKELSDYILSEVKRSN